MFSQRQQNYFTFAIDPLKLNQHLSKINLVSIIKCSSYPKGKLAMTSHKKIFHMNLTFLILMITCLTCSQFAFSASQNQSNKKNTRTTSQQVSLGTDNKMNWISLNTGLIYINSDNGGSSYSPTLGWSPSFPITTTLNLLGNIEIFGVKDTAQSFAASRYELLLKWQITNISLLLGGGFMTFWQDSNPTAAIYDLGVMYQPATESSSSTYFNSYLLKYGSGKLNEKYGSITQVTLSAIKNF